MRIGVFDSGLGGLSVLRAIGRALDEAGADIGAAADASTDVGLAHALTTTELLYVADSGHAPYGEKTAEQVLARCHAVASFLRQQGADLLVIACNTATAVAAGALREAHAGWPIVGVEPGVKPAAALSRNGRIGVMATEVTLASDKFRLLAQAHAAHVELLLQPCPGLAAAIEAGDLDAAPLRRLIHDSCAPLRAGQVDTVVLGCTHYPFVAHHIAAEFGPDVTLIDTADAVAQRTLALARELSVARAASASTGTGSAVRHPRAPDTARTGRHRPLRLWTSGDVATLQRLLHDWLGLPGQVQALPCDAAPLPAPLPAPLQTPTLDTPAGPRQGLA